ncbi:MAG: DUF892 family protein [Gammaproteobacteria bacterium]|nr:DUF892 family protein [Gammaproteobacteria bacterium]
MTTLVGTQDNFVDALYQLCELDYDAVEAYQAAINRLDREDYKGKLNEFKADHERHIREIRSLLSKHQADAPDSPSAKHLVTQGKVVLANLFGDDAILKAMLSNEVDTNTAYERLNTRADEWDDAKEILMQGLSDERRHKAWIENTLSSSQRKAA